MNEINEPNAFIIQEQKEEQKEEQHEFNKRFLIKFMIFMFFYRFYIHIQKGTLINYNLENTNNEKKDIHQHVDNDPRYINEDDEKMDLLLKLKSLEENGEIRLDRCYSIKSNIEDIRMECRNHIEILSRQEQKQKQKQKQEQEEQNMIEDVD